ncbi:SDR family oxidoreductase [Streptococcus sobrinus]|uniref:Oxidoreductase, short chain dehydrogenase/reductase family protein n=5 Tax=Streptococcus sobrinus TaxID=1310 RepID=U2JGB7_9STRE|nr:SDR family oxidoreductase [Streptococcus sobrinus]AWN19680.1 SDR family NAD(P)-dependent oxidoreductase [Streptococcus sobrinus]AWN21624.1 SDR family NAD(P)-dependent oxidoreductase [Streptococcus sobrinus]AWN62408.1 SDR family NAD(P)-dependent oxidoreductase [Streptococcus sobrinus]AWN64283.1 SDR family NAD(P)-dependent oxidoreductase [Streptococcus sobrinus]EMP71877.1 sorbitol-6-phosphate 2-dehydrogenase [Streptococcus sobrinus DSM 20742 = ATCC 33478]
MKDWLNIAGKTVIVTGASSGIGQAIVKELLDLEVNVVNFDIANNDLEHEHYLFVKVDVTSRQEVEAGVAAVVERFGTVDAVVNNAGINVPRLLVDPKDPHGQYELDDAIFEKITMINQKGVFLVSQAVGRLLVAKKQGVIINMASEAGLEGSEGQSAYAATKAAVYSYTRSWAKELGKHGVRVVGIAPGIMEATGLRTLAYEEALGYTRGKTVDDIRAGYASTSTTPLGRSGKLSEVADLVAYYISDRSSYITGITTNVAGGKTRG